MAALKTEHKQFIVKEIACFRPAAEIKKLLHEYFSIDATLQQIYNFDPTKTANENRVSKSLRDLFAQVRKAFVEDVSTHEAHQLAYRLGRLQRMSERAEAVGNSLLAASLLEQAAKDMGGVFTNRREITGKEGKDFQGVTIYIPSNGRDGDTAKDT